MFTTFSLHCPDPTFTRSRAAISIAAAFLDTNHKKFPAWLATNAAYNDFFVLAYMRLLVVKDDNKRAGRLDEHVLASDGNPVNMDEDVKRVCDEVLAEIEDFEPVLKNKTHIARLRLLSPSAWHCKMCLDHKGCSPN